VSEFATYAVAVGNVVQAMMLQRCSSCGEYLTLDSRQISSSQILEKIGGTKSRMRTVTMQVNSELYERLEELIKKETDGKNNSKIMSEILGLGIQQYKKILSRESP
jgi:hypothetical protein